MDVDKQFARCITIVVLFVFGYRGDAWAQPKITVDQILAKWQDRQQKVVSARFTWDEETNKPKGSVSELIRIALPPKYSPGTDKVYPPQDHTFTKPRYVSFDGEKLRYEYETEDWREEIKISRHVFTFDGYSGRHLHETDGRHADGSIREEDRHTETTNFHIRAILMSYRPLQAKLSPYADAKITMTGRVAVIGGNQAIELLCERRAHANSYVWVDGIRDFVPVRVVCPSTNGVDLARLDVDYEQHEAAGWVPKAWTIIERRNDGALLLSSKSSLKSVEVNCQIPEKEFTPEFPVGAVVNNLKLRQTFIQRKGGEQRILSNSELTRPYEELLDSSEPSRIGRLFLHPVAIGAMVLLIFAGLFAGTYLVLRRARLKRLQ